MGMKVDPSLISDLLEAAMSADYTGVRRIGNRLAKLAAEDGKLDIAKAIQSTLRRRGVPLQSAGYSEALPRDTSSRLPLVEEGSWPSAPLFFDHSAEAQLEQFLEDANHIQLLSQKGVSSRLGLLLFGPPGTGKSMLAGWVASKLGRPIYIARLDSMISSRLGETSKNIRELFDFIPTREAVLFLDEMDAIAKLRDDRHELGELKRVVNTVLQGLDSLTDDIIVIGATNHAHLLDPAIWRRFPYKLSVDLPDTEVRSAMWRHYLFEDRPQAEADPLLLSRLSEGLSGADIEALALAARRRAIISGDTPNVGNVLLALASGSSSARQVPDRSKLSTEQRRIIARKLSDAGASVQDMARIAGVSRQMIHRYLRDEELPGEDQNSGDDRPPDEQLKDDEDG